MNKGSRNCVYGEGDVAWMRLVPRSGNPDDSLSLSEVVTVSAGVRFLGLAVDRGGAR